MINFEIDPSLRLTSVAPPDADELFELIDRNRARLREWLAWLDKTRELKDTISFIKFSMESEKDDGAVTAAIRFHGKIVGMVALHKPDWATASVSMGYWIGEEAAGKGIVTRSLARLVEFAFHDLKLEKVRIKCATENHKSAAVPKRLGFQFEETVPDAEWLYDHHVDFNVFLMKKSDWKGL